MADILTSVPGPVEARSLSSITTIAANPPAYPRNPTQTRLDPLALYIVRVPGSKGEHEKKSLFFYLLRMYSFGIKCNLTR